MNLAWLAAVLQPHDVSAHPNFSDDSYSKDPAGQLASLIIGGDWWRPMGDDAEKDEAVSFAEKSFNFETIAEGAEGLVRLAFARDRKDAARSAALVLVACCALAEMEEYEKCDEVLTEMLARVGKTPQGQLVRAALFQQRALRRRDAGSDYIGDIYEVARLLEDLKATDFPEFRLGPGTVGRSADTLSKIIYSLKRSAWSLTPPDMDDQLPTPSFPSRMERLKRPLSERLLRIGADRALEYSDYVHSRFSSSYGRSRTITIGKASADLFHEALAVELLGHAEVYRARRDLALLRLVQHAEGISPINVQDALRLLRHAGATKELELSLEYFRATGPLSVLSWDARQILLRRSSPGKLRVPELAVLRAAAEMMAPPEAENALRIVLASISDGGPPDVAGQWQHPVLKLGAAWLTAAVLSNVCQKGDEIAELLLLEARADRLYDEMHDRSLAKALDALPWSTVSDSLKRQWGSWLTSEESESLPDTREVVSMGIDRPMIVGESLSGLKNIATRLNLSRGEESMRLREDELADAMRVVSQHLEATRQSALRGSFSMGTHSASQICALLISEYESALDLWDPLSQFLTSSQISRLDRSPAFELLARNKPSMPVHIRAVFQVNIDDVLASRDESLMWGDSTIPYPAALRFAVAYNLIDGPRIMAALAELSGSADLEARREAARTLAALASGRDGYLFLPFALQMTHESDVATKANAARYLARTAASAGELNQVATRRLIDLLGNEDGLLVPLFVLRELMDLPELPGDIVQVIEQLSDEHPSIQVRRAASRWRA